MSLLDSSIKQYIIQKKPWSLGTSDILNSQGEKIGTITSKDSSIINELRLMNSDRNMVCRINKKEIGPHLVYDIIDSSGEKISRVEGSLDLNRSSLVIRDRQGNIICEVKGNIKKWHWMITDSKNIEKIYVEINRRTKLASALDFKDSYLVQIKDADIQRFLLLAYAIVITDMYHIV